MKHIDKNRTARILDQAQGKTIAVIGDVMLDRYFWGSVSRISPEAPVPVIDVESETFHLGGAANVAKNLRSLGLEPLLCGIIGDDNSGAMFRQIAESSGINTMGLYVDSGRPTTVKTRIIGNNQQIARIDREVKTQLPKQGLELIKNCLINQKELAGVILEDYNKGTLTSTLISDIIHFCNEKNIPVFVDPKSDNFFVFKNVTCFKPNRKEAQQALGIEFDTIENLHVAGIKLLDTLHCDSVLITLGSAGMMLFESDGTISSVPTKARHISDVSGAGDTAIAVIAATYAGGADIKEAATLSNNAAGLVCEKPGIVTITIEELIESIGSL
ncbi:MAG: D-glycero-beta-D-manno-heptose-7-phosphate kinase [Desulfobulbaceae bacterium]|nr:D-glycero-beta-D-manno-heptose-7-phosphate kinase [Candidatus Kapabacteria bacterium]MBS4001093.1 D-glycero-beta-D-manno-heptose-7-phosphate kinase [Desulfobulbaceae bacterium]